MRLVECIGGEGFPVAPDLLQHLRVIAILLSSFNELRLHLFNDGLLLLSHGLAQLVALTAGEVGEQSAQQHHLLLIDGDAIGILQIFLHDGNIVGDRFLAMLAPDELGNVAHRTGTIEGIHGDEVLEDGGLKLAEVFLHACRLKLERTHGTALLIEFVSLGVVDRDVVEVDVDSPVLLDDGTSLLHLAERFQSEKVHLDKPRRLDDVTIVLRTVGLLVLEVRVVGRADRNPVADGIAADNEAAGMNTRAANGTLKHFCIFDGVGQYGIRRGFGLPQLTNGTDSIGKVHLRSLAINIGQTVRNSLAQTVRLCQRQFLYACYILDGVLRSHRCIGDDMGTVLMAILILNPFQHTATTVVVEVGIDIRQRNAVGV